MAEPEERGVVMYSHNGGIDYGFLRQVQAWLKKLPPLDEKFSDPTTRREPSALVPQFIADPQTWGVDRLTDSTTQYGWLDWGFWEVDVFTGKATRLDTEG